MDKDKHKMQGTLGLTGLTMDQLKGLHSPVIGSKDSDAMKSPADTNGVSPNGKHGSRFQAELAQKKGA